MFIILYYKMASQQIRRILDDFVSLVFPKICIHCGTPLVYQEEHICTSCRIDLPKTNFHLFPENALEQKFVYEPLIKGVSSYLYFHKRGLAQSIIHSIKYAGLQELGVMVGVWYGEELSKSNWEIDMVIPIPLHKTKLKRRGFNQSALIADGISQSLTVEMRDDLVIRKTKTKTQTRKSKAERLQNVESIYLITNTDSFDQKNVLIVDDVITTGATTGELASLLTEQTNVSGIYIASIAAGT